MLLFLSLRWRCFGSPRGVFRVFLVIGEVGIEDFVEDGLVVLLSLDFSLDLIF